MRQQARAWALGLIVLVGGSVSHGQDKEPEKPKKAQAKETKKTPDTEARFQAALDAKGKFQFVDVPLTDVVKAISEKLKTPIILDREGLGEVGLSADTPVTIAVSGLSNRSILRLITQPLDLAFMIQDEVLLITNVERAESNLRTRFFPIADIAVRDGRVDSDNLIEAITSVIEPNSWEDVGGPGVITVYKTSLVISQTESVLNKVEQLLAGVRKAITTKKDRIPFELSPQVDATLRTKTRLHFVDVGLGDVAQQIASHFEVPVLLDRAALEIEGIAFDTPVSGSLDNITLGPGMRLMLKLASPTLRIEGRGEAIVITTIESQELSACLYCVDDLCKSMDEIGELADVMQQMIVANSWSWAGGPCECQPLNYQRPMLLISQTDKGHQDVEAFLKKLRQAEQQEREKHPGLDEMLKPSNEVVLRSYSLNENSKSVSDIVKVIPTLMPETWDEDGILLKAVAGRLVVRHRAGIHKELRSMLNRLGVQMINAEISDGNGGGFGGGGMGGGGFGGGGAMGGGGGGGGGGFGGGGAF